jgi:hypothetical protein
VHKINFRMMVLTGRDKSDVTDTDVDVLDVIVWCMLLLKRW